MYLEFSYVKNIYLNYKYITYKFKECLTLVIFDINKACLIVINILNYRRSFRHYYHIIYYIVRNKKNCFDIVIVTAKTAICKITVTEIFSFLSPLQTVTFK